MLHYLCVDCAMWAANRDDSGASPEWDARAKASRYVVIGDSEEFSSVPCASCGTPLAGTRFAADVIA